VLLKRPRLYKGSTGCSRTPATRSPRRAVRQSSPQLLRNLAHIAKCTTLAISLIAAKMLLYCKKITRFNTIGRKLGVG